MVALGAAMSPMSAQAQELSTREVITTIAIALPLSTTSYAVERTINRVIDKAVDEMISYIDEYEQHLRDALALGAGASLDDLAAMYEIAPHERAAFGKLVRARRVELHTTLWGPNHHLDRACVEAFVLALWSLRDEVRS
jgi:hypothetical protein